MPVAGVASVHAFAGLTTSDGRKPRVAIVGGTPAGVMVATVLCDQFGCEPVNARSGEAIRAILSRDRTPDLIIMDLAVADTGSLVTAEIVRAICQRSALPVVALAASRGEMAASNNGVGGFVGSVLKPYSPRELYTAIQSALTLAAPHAVAGHA